MNENLKIAGGITLKSVAKWILIVFLGGFMTVLSLLVCFFKSLYLLGDAARTLPTYVSGLLAENPPALILIFGAPVFLIVYFVLANKISVQTVVYHLFKSKAGDYVTSAIVTAVEKITGKQGWHSEIINKMVLKAKVLQAVKDNPNSSRIQRSIIRYGFRKVKMEDVDFQNENLDLSGVLTSKFSQYFEDMVRPSLTFFWILLLLQFTLFICSLFLG